MTATFLLAVTATFATKKTMAKFEGAMTPTGCLIGPLDQTGFCLPTGSGPQCTVTLGGLFGTTFPATRGVSGCTIPLFLN